MTAFTDAWNKHHYRAQAVVMALEGKEAQFNIDSAAFGLRELLDGPDEPEPHAKKHGWTERSTI